MLGLEHLGLEELKEVASSYNSIFLGCGSIMAAVLAAGSVVEVICGLGLNPDPNPSPGV